VKYNAKNERNNSDKTVYCKNLFLKDRKGKFYYIICHEDNTVSLVIADSLLFFISVSLSLEEEKILLISVSSSLEEEEAISNKFCFSCLASSEFTELFEGSFGNKQVGVEMSWLVG
jgi:hypothetical protein